MAKKPLTPRGQSFIDKLKDASTKRRNATSRSGKPSSGTMTSPERIESIKKNLPDRKGPGKPNVGEKKNLPDLRRKTTEPDLYKKKGVAVEKYKKPSTSVERYKKPGGSVTRYKPGGGAVTAAEEGITARGIAGTLAKGAWRWGGGPAAALVGMTEPVDVGGDKPEGPLMKGNASVGGGRRRAAGTYFPGEKEKRYLPTMIRKDRSASGTYTAPYEPKAAPKGDKETKPSAPSKAQSFKDKMQGRNYKGAAPKAAKPSTGASKAPEKPFSEFEQGKVKRYVKEGFGGRSMTKSDAEARVRNERGYKTFKR